MGYTYRSRNSRLDAATDAGSAAIERACAAATSSAPNILAGTSTTVITAEEIARSPAQTLQEIIAQVPGVQLTTLYGGVNGAGTTVDLRGFGATAFRTRSILINGRRVNDLDMQGVDFSTIPRDSIERIEITKATAARCFTATTPSAASSTSSPRPG